MSLVTTRGRWHLPDAQTAAMKNNNFVHYMDHHAFLPALHQLFPLEYFFVPKASNMGSSWFNCVSVIVLRTWSAIVYPNFARARQNLYFIHTRNYSRYTELDVFLKKVQNRPLWTMNDKWSPRDIFSMVSIFGRRNTVNTSFKRLQLDCSNDTVTHSPALDWLFWKKYIRESPL
jgi:hypothetical protein